jgi:hypothetical protein
MYIFKTLDIRFGFLARKPNLISSEFRGLQGHSAKCWEFGISQKNFKIEWDSTKWDSVVWRASWEKLGIIGSDWRVRKNREKSVIIGIPIFPNNSWLGNYRESVLVICFGNNQPCVCVPAEHCCSIMLPSPIGDCSAASSTKHLCHH